ncbi:hypothetical protein LOK49_Contig11G00005 [Camellia lanceoleosa]|nr:hypothetical protein LOK49_Contig11G00005 [Camellia lanceoleosa]
MMSGCGELHHPFGHGVHNLGHHSPGGHNEHDMTALQLVAVEDTMVTAGYIMVMAGDIIFINMFTVNITDMVAMVVVTMEDITVMVGDIMVTMVAVLAKGTIAMVDVEVTVHYYHVVIVEHVSAPEIATTSR